MSASRLADDLAGHITHRNEVNVSGGWDEVLASVGKTPRGLPDETVAVEHVRS